MREGHPRPGFGLSPLFCGKEWTDFALFSFKIWEQTKTSCCSFSVDIKGQSLSNFRNQFFHFWQFCHQFLCSVKKKLVSSSPNLVVPSYMQCCQRLRLIQNIFSLFIVYICHWQHCKNYTNGHMGKRKSCKAISTGRMCANINSRRIIASLSN